MTKPTGTGWIKCPSVTTGGKAYFWHRRIDRMLQWYMWDRRTQQWLGQIEVFAADPRD